VTSATSAPYGGHNVEVDLTKYAHLEDEQRFVLPGLPEGSHAPRAIEDRYVLGTRLRVRTVTDEASGEMVGKLGHKRRLDQSHPSAVWHTTIYLDESELEVLRGMPARVLIKRRWTVAGGSADEFLGDLTGLVLFEGLRPVVAPGHAVEVTDDERFCGGSLAALGRDAAVMLVEDARRLVA
jgi:CYTH domain-containing protein